MTKFSRTLFTLMALSWCFLFYLQQGYAQRFELAKGKISFKSDADLEAIEAASTKVKGLVDIDKKAFAFNVDIATFEGFNSELQKEHFNENYLESNIYPTASFAGKIIDKIDIQANTQTVRAKGMLKIHGIEHERIINVILTKKGNEFEISSSFNVLLSDHGITIPRIVYQKIAEIISVNVTGTLKIKA